MSRKHVTTYEQLKFTDDFLFCKILENNPKLCQELLEVILKVKIRKVEYVSKQKEFDVRSDGRGVRFDVYLEDTDNRVYDIEMQTARLKDIPKRSRYYQGIVDTDAVQKGCWYTDLKDSYIIFICTSDPFYLNLPVYHFENLCLENTDLSLKDGTEKVFVNAKGMREGVSEDMKAFLDFLEGKENDSQLAEKLHAAVDKAKLQEEWRHEYMTLAEKYEHFFEEGREEGREVGREEGREEGRWDSLLSLVKKGLISAETAADELGISVEEFQKKTASV